MSHAPELVLAHTLLEPHTLPLPPLSLAGAAVVLVVLVGRTGTAPTATAESGASTGSAGGRAVTTVQHPSVRLVPRALGLAGLVLTVLAGRVGVDSAVENLTPVLLLLIGWIGMLVASVSLGDVWGWVDPFDTLARLSATSRGPGHRGDVVPAVVVALGWSWLLAVHPRPTSPRALAAALAVYTVVTLGAGMVAGHTWLGRGELFGIVFGWAARLRRDLLRDWEPPRGALAVLGVLAGGLLFSAMGASELGAAGRRSGDLADTVGLLVVCAMTVAVLTALEWSARRAGADGLVAAALVPVVVSLALATSFVSIDLVANVRIVLRVASDPLGLGWDLLGTANATLPWQPSPASQAAIQVVLLTAGGIVAAAVVRRRAGEATMPGVLAAAILVGVGILVLAASGV